MKMQDEFSKQFAEQVKGCAATIEQVASGESELGDVAEYFEDVLDVEIISDLRGEYRGAKIWLTLGGPNICLDTRESCVKGYWWSDRAECHVQKFAVDAVDEYYSELWEMTRGY